MTGPAVPPGGEELREAIADALAYWYPDSGTGQAHIRDEHLEAADAILALPAIRDALAAQETLRWVEALIGRWAGSPRGLSAAALLSDLRRALAGDS